MAADFRQQSGEAGQGIPPPHCRIVRGNILPFRGESFSIGAGQWPSSLQEIRPQMGEGDGTLRTQVWGFRNDQQSGEGAARY